MHDAEYPFHLPPTMTRRDDEWVLGFAIPTARAETEVALMPGKSLRSVAAEFGIGRMALQRHKADHLTPALIQVRHSRQPAEP
jgi:hypothetical protein